MKGRILEQKKKEVMNFSVHKTAYRFWKQTSARVAPNSVTQHNKIVEQIKTVGQTDVTTNGSQCRLLRCDPEQQQQQQKLRTC